MGRQVILFGLICLGFAFLMRDAQSEFLGIWLELKAAGKVTVSDYDSTWAQFILPRVALFALILMPVTAFSSMTSGERKRRRCPLKALLISILGNQRSKIA